MPLLSRPALAACSFSIVLSAAQVARAGVDASSSEAVAAPGTEAPATAKARDVPRASPDADAPQAPRPSRQDAKRFVVARDFGLTVPVGPLADEAAPMYGPLVRLGFHLSDSVEVGLRAAYQRGFDKSVAGVEGSLSSVPFNASVRWFVLGDRSGPYAGAEAGANVFRYRAAPRTSFFDVGADSTWVRPCAGVGVGFVWSRAFPLDVRAQLASLDLVSKGGPARALAVGATAGYSFFF
ncbi:MAG: hypothetical protein KIS78_05705 [Labilithrix sp.]|nr:hypothetical protein [Labilithrix sp.]